MESDNYQYEPAVGQTLRIGGKLYRVISTEFSEECIVYSNNSRKQGTQAVLWLEEIKDKTKK